MNINVNDLRLELRLGLWIWLGLVLPKKLKSSDLASLMKRCVTYERLVGYSKVAPYGADSEFKRKHGLLDLTTGSVNYHRSAANKAIKMTHHRQPGLYSKLYWRRNASTTGAVFHMPIGKDTTQLTNENLQCKKYWLKLPLHANIPSVSWLKSQNQVLIRFVLLCVYLFY